MNTVIITPQAEESYRVLLQNIYDYSVNKALKLEERVDKQIARLEQFSENCPPIPEIPKYRKCVILANISMLYEIQNPTRILVVAFIDNRMEHDF
jgi:plasmid stabilization system protein ParE